MIINVKGIKDEPRSKRDGRSRENLPYQSYTNKNDTVAVKKEVHSKYVQCRETSIYFSLFLILVFEHGGRI